MEYLNYIDGVWRESLETNSEKEAEEAIQAAHRVYKSWRSYSFDQRAEYLYTFVNKLKISALSETISKDTGKPLWEANQEVTSMIQKVEITISAFQQRCPQKKIPIGPCTLNLNHKPHGVIAVLGPFNLPGHLPNGHIMPALLAGNTIVFKGSELTPRVNKALVQLWEDLPKGVLNLVQGGAQVGQYLTRHALVNGLFFTGSYKTGMSLLKTTCLHPEKILALEMGGNNPLIIWDVPDLEAASYLTIQSAFLTSGQRCTCARRLIIPNNKFGDDFLKILVKMSSNIKVGHYAENPEPFMGPVINLPSAIKLLSAQKKLADQGGVPLLEMRTLSENTPFLSAGIMDVTTISDRKDEELFGPFLQVIRVLSFDDANMEANNTGYGLVASIFTQDEEKFKQFYQEIQAGVINWNTPTTGASSQAPFGGVGKSGNYRPSGYYACDYCVYPVASIESKELFLPKELNPGITSAK